MQDRNDDRDLLLHAGGQIGHFHLRKLRDAEALEQLFLAFLRQRRLHLMQFGKKVKQCVRRKKLFQLQLACQKADLFSYQLRLSDHACAIHQRITFIRADQCRQHAQRSRLTGPVGTEQTKDLSFISGK